MNVTLRLKGTPTLKLRYLPGLVGPSGEVSVGTVTTGAPGSDVIISNSGTASAAILNFTIPRGDVGATGDDGWSPVLAVVTDGIRRVLQITDWTGGEGTKPATGSYIGPTGLVSLIVDAVDIRGEVGPAGSVTDGDKGDVVVSASGTVWTVDARAVSFAKTQAIATSRILGRVTASSGDIEELTGSQATGLLPAFTGDAGAGGVKGLVPAPAAGDADAGKVLGAGGGWVNQSAISPLSYGCVGDGVTDDTTGLQNAINAAGGKELNLGGAGKTYKITAPLSLPADTRIVGNGATIDMRSIGSAPYHGLVAQGSLGTSSALSANGTAGSFSVTVANGSLFAAGDYVLISSDANYSYSGYNVDKAEIKRIRSIATNTISFTAPLSDSYNTADTATLRNVSWVENIHVKGVRVLGSNTAGRGERGICLRWVKNFSIEQCDLIDQDIYQVEATASILGRIADNYLHGVFYDGVTGTTFYGIVLNNSTTWVNVEGNFGDRNRHLVVTTAFSEGNGYYGQPMFVTVANNKMFDAQAGDAGRSFAFECHGFGRFIDWIGNQADGCYAGLRLENGNDNKVIGNTFRNYAYQGIIVGGNGLNNRNILISDNIVSAYTGEVTTGNPCAVAIVADVTGASFVDIVIANNIMVGLHTSGVGTGVQVLPNTSTFSGIEISSNLIDGVDADAVAIVGAAGAHELRITNNRIIGYRGGISLFGNRCTVKNNRIERTSAAASGFGIYSNGDRTIIQGNELRFINTPIRTDTGSTSNLGINNQFVQCTNLASNSGTSNVFRDSDVI